MASSFRPLGPDAALLAAAARIVELEAEVAALQAAAVATPVPAPTPAQAFEEEHPLSPALNPSL